MEVLLHPCRQSSAFWGLGACCPGLRLIKVLHLHYRLEFQAECSFMLVASRDKFPNIRLRLAEEV